MEGFSVVLLFITMYATAGECGVIFEQVPKNGTSFVEEGKNHTLIWTYRLTPPHSQVGVFKDINLIRKRETEETLAGSSGAVPASIGKIEVTAPSTFTIINFTKSDVGTYFVILSFFGRADIPSAKDVALNLKEMAMVELTLPLQIKRQDLLVLGEGTSAKLECTATGGPPPNITWYKELKNDRVEVKNENGIKIETEGLSSNLTITKATYEDNAKYLCVGNNFGNESVVGSFLVVPFIYVPEDAKKYFTKPKNGAIVLTCPVIGFPTPVYEWFVEGKKAKETSQTREISSRGNYTCYGSNMGGKISFNFTVEDGLEMNCNKPPIVKWNSPGEVQRYLVSYTLVGGNKDIGVLTGKSTELEITNNESSTGRKAFSVTVEAIMSDNAVLEGKCQNFEIEFK